MLVFTTVLGTSLPPVGTHIGLASYSSSIRRGSARRPLLSPAENKGFAAAAKRPETPTHVAQAKGHAAAHAWLVARGGVATAPAKKKSSFSFSPKKLSPKKSPSK